MGTITISTMTAAISMISSVEPASSCTFGVASVVSVIAVGVAVASWVIGRGRLSARPVNNIESPSITQIVMRKFLDAVFIMSGWWISITPRIPRTKTIRYGSLGISVVDTRILECERAYARSHSKIRPFSWQILENLRYLREIEHGCVESRSSFG